MTWLHEALTRLPAPDAASAAAVRARADDVLRPVGALARLDDVAVHIAGWSHSTDPAIRRPAGVVFAADHGVAVNSAVSAYPSEVTAAMLAVCRDERATINVLARLAGAELRVVDVGVGNPTGDIRTEDAMSDARFAEVIDVAVATVDSLDTDLLVVGEIGIGNTTVAAALTAALLGGESSLWVGPGSGVDAAGLERKRGAVAMAIARVADSDDPIEVMRRIGGAELTAMAAAVVAARLRSIPVVLDGYISTAAVLPLHVAEPTALDHCLIGHVSAEPGHRRVLDAFGRQPLLDLGMRLGEGSGAMAAVPIVQMACKAVTEVGTFTEQFGQARG